MRERRKRNQKVCNGNSTDFTFTSTILIKCLNAIHLHASHVRIWAKYTVFVLSLFIICCIPLFLLLMLMYRYRWLVVMKWNEMKYTACIPIFIISFFHSIFMWECVRIHARFQMFFFFCFSSLHFFSYSYVLILLLLIATKLLLLNANCNVAKAIMVSRAKSKL